MPARSKAEMARIAAIDAPANTTSVPSNAQRSAVGGSPMFLPPRRNVSAMPPRNMSTGINKANDIAM